METRFPSRLIISVKRFISTPTTFDYILLNVIPEVAEFPVLIPIFIYSSFHASKTLQKVDSFGKITSNFLLPLIYGIVHYQISINSAVNWIR